MDNKWELFDQKVEQFLKKQMSSEEEQQFKEELTSDREKLERAQAIALVVKQMKNKTKDKDVRLVETMQKINEEQVDPIVVHSDIEDFDHRVDRYLRNLMTDEEKEQFMEELNSSSELRERARTIALTIQQMKTTSREEDEKILAAIKSILLINSVAAFRLPDSAKNAAKIILDKSASEESDTDESGEGTSIRVAQADTPTKQKPLFSLRILAIAASLLILAGFFGISQYDVSQVRSITPQYEQFTSEMNNQMLSRSKGSSEDKETIKMLSDYFENIRNGDYLNETIDNLEKIANNYKTVEFASYEEYSSYIDWNLAIAYLKDGNKKKAKLVLNRLIQNHSDEPIADKAKELIEKINDISLF